MRALPLNIVVAISLLSLPAGAWADCSPATGVMMNEVRYYDTPSPDGLNYVHAFVELYNKDTVSVDVTGWTITKPAGAVETVATLPAVSIPAGAHLTVWFGTGVDDYDFSDGIGQVWTNGDSVDVFDKDEDGIALYDDLAAIVDYVTWSVNGSPPAGTALIDAENAGVWAVGDVIPSGDATLSQWRLLPDGYDFHRARDWHNYGWGESYFGANVLGLNSLSLYPDNGGGFEADSMVTLGWGRPNLNSDVYNLMVATDSSMTAVILNVNTVNTDTTLSLAEDTYYWKVSLVDTCGTIEGQVRVFDVFPTAAAPGLNGLAELKYAPTSRYLQHKDTKLLCIYDNKLAGNARGGCFETPSSQGPWDDAHPNNHANFTTVSGAFHVARYSCRHCNQYCGRAGVQMINHKYGGDLSQDRISYAFMVLDGATDPSPEGDLGHNLPALLSDADNVLQWAVKNTTVTGPLAVSFNALKTQIDLGFPALVLIPNHFMVVDAYIEKDSWSPGRPAHDMVRIRDPWPGSRGWTRYSTSGLNNYYRMRISHPDSTAKGRTQEATVTTDTDGDGMMDFDEGAPDYPADRPRKFGSKHTTKDTDLDEVTDKIEVRSYTFYVCGNNDAIGFPDIDNDGLRAEADCDSDHKTGTGCFDGGEDILDTGNCLTRSDPFSAGDDVIFATTDKFLYKLGETVKMGGQYVHADTTYPVDLMIGCPSLVNGQPLGHDASLSSDAGGVIPLQDITVCANPGLYLGVIDILRNNICERGPCHNPDVCWACLIPTFDGDDDDSSEWEDPTGTNNNPSGAYWQPVPDNWFEFTGVSWGIDSFWQPTQPVDAALVTKPIATFTQGDLVFLSYDHAFFGLGGMQGTVLLSTDGGLNFNPILNYPPGDHGGTEVIELTPYLTEIPSAPGLGETAMGPDIVIAFHATSPPGGGAWFVDNVWVGEMASAQVGIPQEPELPTQMIMAPNYPNPFQGETTIRFALPAEPGRVTLEILDINGRRVNRILDADLPAGPSVVTWDGKDALGRSVAAGVYFYRLVSDHGTLTRKMTIIN